MPEYESKITTPEIAPVVLIREARQRRFRGLKSAEKITRTSQHTEGLIFRSSLEELFSSRELVDKFIGDPILLSKAETSEVTLARVREEKYSDGRTHFSVIVSPEEYEWLTVNLEFFEPKKDIDQQIGSQIGRYYRLTNAVNYIIETQGYTNYTHEAFQTEMDFEGLNLDFAPDEDSRGRKDIAKLRVAGGYVLSAMQLEYEQDLEFRDYLNYSIDERLSYTIGTMRFATEKGLQLPPDLDADISHWMGICLPLEISKVDVGVEPLWQPDMNLI